MTSVVLDSRIPYDRGWSWMVVLGTSMMHMFLIGYMKTFGVLFVELQELFQLTSQETAWVCTAMLLTIDILSPLGTALADKFGSRAVVMTGGILVSLSLVLSSFLVSIEYIVALMGVLFGVGSTLCYAPAIITVGYYFKHRLGLANALSTTGSSLGQFILPPIVTVLLSTYSLNGTLLILAAVMFNLTLAGALLRPVTYYTRGASDRMREVSQELIYHLPEKQNSLKSNDEDLYRQLNAKRYDARLKSDYNETLKYASSVDLHCSMNIQTSQIIVEQYRQRSSCFSFLKTIFDVSLLRNPVYTIFALGCTCVNFSYIGTFRYLPAHCKDLGVNEEQRAMLLSLIGIVDLFTRLSIGLVADTWFVRHCFKRYRLLAVSMLVLAGNGLFLVYGRAFWQIVLSCVLYGVFGGVYMTLLSVSLVDLLGAENLSRAWGIMLLLYSVTTIGEPLVLGYLRDQTGSYAASFMTCAALFLSGGLLVMMSPLARRCMSK